MQTAVMPQYVVCLFVCLSVTLSVCLSVTFSYRDHIGWNNSKIILRPN